MTKDRITELYGLAANGIIRPELAANVLADVCETALELFRIVEQQNVRLKNCQRAQADIDDKSQETT
jgi:hypothetical protein